MDTVAEAALEAVPVEQGQEELEVLLLAVVRRRRHQQEVAGQAREELPQAVPFRVLDLGARPALLAGQEDGRDAAGEAMDTDGARRLNRSSPSCLNSGAQRTDFFHGLLSHFRTSGPAAPSR